MCNHNNYRKIAIRNLEAIELELLECHNYYARNAHDIDYNEISQAIKHLDISINNNQNIRKTLIKANSEKIIDIIDRDLQKIASSNIVSEKNVEQFFGQINKLRIIINDSLKHVRFGDIPKEAYEKILNNLEDLNQYLFNE